MATKYKSLKCNCCAGSLEYDKQKKVWICQYCGNEMRREEEYDGLYTIKNVVKQTLVDIAYGRLDSAEKNLSECEKIDSSYIGTLIARLCFKMFTLTTPGACAPGAAKSLIGQLKRGYEELKERDEAISTEEEALYEAFEENGDAFAVLVLVFDSLGDTVHRDFAENLLDAAAVYSPTLNESLLNYAMNSGKMEMADTILANIDNIDCKKAFFLVMNRYGDGEKKREHICRIIANAGIVPDDRNEIEQYLKTSGDSIQTKVCVYDSAGAKGAVASVEYVIQYLLVYLTDDIELLKKVIARFCDSKPNDAELYLLIHHILAGHSFGMASAELGTMEENGTFIVFSAADITAMLNRGDLGKEEKVKFLKLIKKWNVGDKTYDNVIGRYLCGNTDETDIRIKVMQELLSSVKTLATNTVTDYILKCSADGERKPEMIKLLFGLDLNLSFYRELLSNYMRSSADALPVREEIITFLTGLGLQGDLELLVEMACSAGEDKIQEIIEYIRRMTENGMRFRNDALSTYLEKAQEHRYHSQIIKALYSPTGRISAEAVTNYVLFGKDDGTKVENVRTFISQCSVPFGTSGCFVTHLGHTINCNLMQGYVLATADSETTAFDIVGMMKEAGAKLNPMIRADQTDMKFKKYAADNKEAMGALTRKLCEDNKVFSFLF